MAIGDIENNVITIPAGGNTIVQPPAGEAWVVNAISTGGIITAGITDGTEQRQIVASATIIKTMTVVIDNSVFLQFNSSAGGTRNAFYSALEISPASAIVAFPSVPASGTVDIRPPAGTEWTIRAVTMHTDTTLVGTDGVDTIGLQGAGTTDLEQIVSFTNADYGQFQNANATNARNSYYGGFIH